MATDRYLDFDAAFAEEVAEPITVKLFGEEWTLPASMPAAVPLQVSRWMAEGRADSDLTKGELINLAADIVPADILSAWRARGITSDQLGKVIMAIVATYMSGDEASPGEAQGPAAGAPTPSSGTGPSSKPTSPASTGSPSLVT